MNNSTFELGKFPSRNAVIGQMKTRFSSLFSVSMALLGIGLWLGFGQSERPYGLVLAIAMLSLLIKLLVVDSRFKSVFYLLIATGFLSSYESNAQSPGGVSTGLKIWLKADAGFSATTNATTVATWSDQSGNSYNVTQTTGANRPTYYSTDPTKLVNFNPTLSFDGTDDGLVNSTRIFAGTSPYSFIGVEIDEKTNNGYHAIFSAANTFDYFSLHKQGGATADNGFNNYRQGNNRIGKGNGFSPTGGSNGTFNGTNFSANVGIQPQIFGLNSINTIANSPMNTFIDGYKQTTNPTGGLQSLWFGKFSVGNYDANNYPFKGRIPEIMAYSTQLSDTDMQKVNTYLAIKYGVTLGQGNGIVGYNGSALDYVASDNTVIWTGAGNTYNHDIMGIGRDDASGLTQKQSKSVNDDSYVTISNAATVAATNATNNSTFAADKIFEMIGDNGLAASYATNYTANSFTPSVPSAFFGMSRIWKVQETGTVQIGMVTISVPVGLGAERLLVFAPGTTNFGSGAVQEILMVADGSGNMTAQVNFTDGQLFTFGKVVVAPGCVANGLQYWFDAGVSVTGGTANITAWKDKFADFTISKNNSGTITSAAGDAKSNFNPYILFPSNAHLTGVIDPVALGRLNTTFAVAQKDANVNGTYNHAFRFASDPNTAALHDYAVGTVENLGNHYPVHHWITKGTTVNRFNTNFPITFGTVGLYGARINSATALNNKDVSFNGTNLTFSDVITGNISANMQIGGSVYGMQGRIPEVAYYNVALSDADRNKVDSYFGIKYGLTLDHNYFSGAGAVIYDKATYGNNIFGIGRDDCQALIQKQSKSVNADGYVTISNAATVAATNATNTSTFAADKVFEMIGDNGLAASYATNYTANSFTPSVPSAFFGMSRIWKVQETGTVQIGMVTISVPVGLGAERLLVFAPGTTNFGSGAVQEILMVADGSGNMTAQVNFTDGQLFTFGKVVVAPGCVANGLQYWFDAGVSVTGGTANITAWKDKFADFTISKNNSGTITSAAGDAKSNFNPYILFPSNAHLTGVIDPVALGRLNTTFAVAQKDANVNGTYNHAFRFASDPNTAALHDYAVGTVENLGNHYPVHHWITKGTTVNRFNTNFPITFGTVGLYGARINSATALNNKDVSFNGTNLTFSDVITGNISANMQIGGSVYGMQGRIPEVAYYNVALSDADRNKVDSYFGIKYGLTLDHNYFSGAGAVIYDKATYGNNIFGIGRDDCQALIQKQSKSVNADGYVTISNAATVAATNAANTSTFANDKVFEMIGDNGLAASYGTNYVPSTFTPAVVGAFFGMSRIWKVQETTPVGVGMVTISVPAGPERLLVFPAGTTNFSSGATEILMTNDGNGNATAQVDFSNGQLFTFGKVVTSPGCVTANLKAWLKADIGTNTTTDGTNVTSWANNGASGGNAVQVGTNNVPKYLANKHNFNPALDVAAVALNTGLVLSNVFSGVAQRELTFYAVGSRPTYPAGYWMGWGGFYNGNDNNDNPWIGNYGTSFYYWNGTGSGVNDIGNLGMPSYVANQTYISGLTQLSGALQATSGTNLYRDGQGVPFTGNTSGARTVSPDLKIYHDNNTYAYGSISEVIAYDRVLTQPERQRMESYLAVKYGITLTTSYLSGGGLSIWDKTANATYHNNVFGIGRDDCQSLIQKQSTSNTSSMMTLGIDNKIMATNVANTGDFNTNASFLIWGDNGIATGTTTSVTASPCNPESIDKYTARIWKSVETGAVESTKVSVDLSSYAFNANFPVFMQVASSDAFTTFDNVLMVKNGANYETNFDFTGTQFVRFTGNTTPPANVCTGDKEYRWNSPSFWSWSTKNRTSVLGDTQFKVTISDPNNVIYAPTVYPVGQYWWEHLFIPRYDAAGSNTITTRIEMNKVAYRTSFEIFDLDAYYGRDVVKVYGKLAGAIVNPVLTLPTHTALSKTGNTVSATTGVWDISIWGRVYVNFNSPIDEIFIEYSKSGGYAFKTYQDIRISNIDVTCKPFVPEVVSPDNVYIAKQVTKAAPKVGEPFKYKFTVKNLSCNAKTINFTDILPAGSNLKWVDSTLVTSMTYTSASSYGGTQALTITGLSVPVGESYLYINAVGTTAGTYNNQASFTVGVNSYLSDEPNIAGGANPTPVTLTADRPLSNLTITKAVNKTTAAQNEVIKYTYTVTNPNASAVLTNFEDNLPNSVDGGFKYVAGSLSGATGATAVPSSYGGESSLVLTNLSIPTSGLTFSVSVNVGSYTSGEVGKNVASITADPSTIYNTTPIASNTVNTTISGGCSAGSDAPVFAKNTITNLCPSTTINLTAMVATNLPSGTTVTWHTTANASATNLVTNPGTAPAGTYFAAFYDAANTCYSGAGSATTQVVGTVVGCPSNITVSNACPATTFDLTTRAVGPYPSGKTLTWHTGTPTTNLNKINNAATAGNGTYYAAYYDAANDCYSPATSNAITVSIITCATCTAGSTAPAIANTSLTNVCPQTTVDLSKVTASNLPTGSALTWYKTSTPSTAEELSGISSVGAGTYYAAFYDFTANCFSPSTQVTVSETACQNNLYVDLTTAISQPSPALAVAAPSNITVTVSNSGTGPTLIGHPTNTTIALPTGVSAPATFSSNGWNCATTGQAVNCSTSNTIAATNGTSAFVVPITPDASTLGTKPTITADTAPYIIELTTNNNGATMTPTTAVVAPDLTTAIGQPSTPLVVGSPSNIPVTVANIGTGPTTGSPITTTIALPAGVTAPATFTNGAWGCATTGSTVSCTTAGPIANGNNSVFNVPITPSVAGSTPVITGGTVPTQGEVVTNNNGASMTPTTPVAGVPDLTTSIGQPSTPLTAGVASNIPVTVTNIGGGPTTGSPITTTMTLPSGVTAPASFSSNGWACTTTGSTVNCTTAGPIASNGGTTTFNVPVTPNASTVGTSPVFNAGTVPTTNEVTTSNNAATMTPSVAVAAGAVPDLTMSIGQPATPLRIGSASDIPVTITNAGSAATSGGTITSTMTLPANITAPASFASNGWNCATSGSTVSCSITSTLTAGGGTSSFTIPVTPSAAAAGTTPTFNGGVIPTSGETATANNSASMTPSAAILGRPDLTTSIGQPSPALQQGTTSNLPITVTNIGNAPTTGTAISTTVGLPSGVTAPANFSDNGWNCSTLNSVVSCSTPTPLNGGGASSIFNVPITPNASTVGTTPSFTGGTNPDPAETVTSNNNATPLTSSPAVTGLPDLTTTIGQPSTPFTAGLASNVPITVANVGTGPATGPIVTTMTLPANFTAPANFTDGPWTCATTGSTVACTSNTTIPAPGNSVVNVPVTPTTAAIGTTPPFNATTTPKAGEPNTTNNNATPMTPSAAVVGCSVASVGGSVSFAGTLPVCNTANSGTLTLSGNTGNVVRWETSTNGGGTWTTVANTNTTTSYSFVNAANNQQYRAVVKNGPQCTDANATPVTITTNASACSIDCSFPAPVIVK